MCDLICEWRPSQSAVDIIKLNGINDEQILNSVEYLKKQTELNSIDNVEGYDNWNTFFIMFCIKVNNSDG